MRDARSIVFAEFHPWETPLKVGGHRYAEQFANDHWQVLWLANFLNVNRIIRRNEYDRIYLQNWRRGVAQVAEHIYTYTPFSLLPYINMPVLSSLPIARRSLRWCWPALPDLLRKIRFPAVDVLWISQPRLYSLVHVVEHQVLAYRMFDDVQHFKGEPGSIQTVERQLCEQADVVFATSRLLVEKARRWSSNVVYLPNGADVERFTEIVAPEPADLAAIPHPRLLYVGAISYWFDFELIAAAARARPDWSFVLIGPVAHAEGPREHRFENLPNVYLLGQRHPHDVPAYMHNADIGLIPFQATDLTHSVSPIKLFEYSSAGLPVVAPALHEMQAYVSPTLFYTDRDGFIGAVETGLHNHDALAPQFVAFGLANSWHNRYRTVLDTLSALQGVVEA